MVELRDRHILAGIVVCWMLLLVWTVARWHKKISRKPARGLNTAILKFLKRLRSYDQFFSDETGTIVAEASLHLKYRSRRRTLYLQLFETAFIKAFGSVIFAGLLSASLVWLFQDGFLEGRFKLDTMLEGTAACLRVYETLVPLAAILLALYVQLRLARFFKVVNAVWEVQETLEQIAMVVGSSAGRYSEHDEVREALWSLSRLLNLVHILVYQQILGRFKWSSYKDIFRAGFIHYGEMTALEASSDVEGTAVLWTCQLLTLMVDTQVLDIHLARTLLKLVHSLRQMSSSLVEEIARCPPVSMVSTLHLLVDVVCLFTPPALVFDFVSGRTIFDTVNPLSRMNVPENASFLASSLLDKSRYTTYAVPALSSMVLSFFYQGSLSVVEETQHMFEMGADSLDLSGILEGTESRIAAYLKGKPLVHLQPISFRGQDAKSVVSQMLKEGSDKSSERSGATSSRVSRVSSCPAAYVRGGASVMLTNKMLEHVARNADIQTMDLQRYALEAVANAAAASAKAEPRKPPKSNELELLEMLRAASRENARLREQLIGKIVGPPPDTASASGSSVSSKSEVNRRP